MEGFSLADIRKQNTADVYHLIYQQKCASKQQIATTLQLSLPTVTQHLAALMERDLIEKGGQLASSIGRKAATFQIKPAARVSIGVEILSNQATIVALDLYGAVIGKTRIELPFAQDGRYYDALAQSINALLEQCRFSREQVLGISFGMQGLVSEDRRTIIYGKILGCTGMTIEPLESRLTYPCCYAHDAECAAELELWRVPEVTDAIYLSLSRNLGGAVIANGRPQSGRTGRTGTFEHMTLIEGGRQCYCGKHGCMDRYCSTDALLENGESLESFFSALRGGSPAHEARWAQYMGWLAMSLNNIHMAIDSVIVLGGHMAPYLTDADLDTLFAMIQQRTAFPESENFLRLGVQETDVVAIGAAIPYIRSFLASI